DQPRSRDHRPAEGTGPRRRAALPLLAAACRQAQGPAADPDRGVAPLRAQFAAVQEGLRRRFLLADALAGLRIEQVDVPGVDVEAALLARLGDDVAGLAHRHQLAALAETAVQQRVGAERL